ncbi:MAG TPA: NAD(P)-dependent oxidoreductase [Alphaproteobacteria bacterium]|nr:NAD(P)-dependent oxidoreductase [Alphaproteobacteria bacterium]
MTAKPRIGFIGLGLMGNAATKFLVTEGYGVTGYDIVADKVAAAEANGIRGAASPAEVTQESDIVICCVTSTAAVEEAVLGPGGVIETGTPDKVLVDISTTVTETTRQMAERLARECGMKWVDAPVSGGPPAAGTGTLAIMAGGDDAAIAQVSGVMNDLAATFTHMGPVGAGQITKMINQVLVLTNYCVLAEALRMAEKGGIDAAKIPGALAPGHAGSNMLQSIYPRMLERDFAPAGYARQVLKDLDMVHDLAKDLKAPTPMASQAAALFRLLIARGHGELDGIAVLKLYDDEPV